MANPQLMLQVVSQILQSKTAQQESAKDRAFKVQLQDMANKQAREMVDYTSQAQIEIGKKTAETRTAEQIKLLTDEKVLAAQQGVAEKARQAVTRNLLISTYGADVGNWDKDGKFVSIMAAAVKRNELNEGEIKDAPIWKQKVVDQPGGWKVNPAKYEEIAKRNPYFSETNDPMQIYNQVVERLRDGTATQDDVNLIPAGSRSRYQNTSFDRWFSDTAKKDLQNSINKKVMIGDINTGYDESYAVDSDKIQLPDVMKEVIQEVSPKDWYKRTENRKDGKPHGIYRTSKGELWINGTYQGDGAKMSDWVRNPKVPQGVSVAVDPKKGGRYTTIQESVAKASAMTGAMNQILAENKKLMVTAQRHSEDSKFEWYSPRAFQLQEKGGKSWHGLDWGGYDENEVLAQLKEQLEHKDIEGNKVELPYESIQNQVAHAKNLWNDPNTGNMHEYRKSVIEQLSSLIRTINRDVDMASKDKLYDPKQNKKWKEHAISDPNKWYSSAVEKSTWLEALDPEWGGVGGFIQNYSDISTYDEYVEYMRTLVRMKEELMMTPRSNDQGSPFWSTVKY